jgi:hypothetical protein
VLDLYSASVIDQPVPHNPMETNMTAMMRGLLAAFVLTTGALQLAGCADTSQPQQSAVSDRIPTANFAPPDHGGTFVSQSIPGIQSGDGFD